MLKINTNFKKYKIPLIAVTAVLGGVFLFQYLTFIPEYSSAEEIPTPVMGEAKPDTRTLSQITYMQEMTSGICERSAENETKQLIDKRDDKNYWVTKLKDGNCWMTQNLDLDISSEGLFAETTDILTDWGSNAVYRPTTTIKENTIRWWQDADNIAVQSYDPGMFVYKSPSSSLSGCATVSDLDLCDAVYNVESTKYKAKNIVSTNQVDNAVDTENSLYDAHYLVGNFYSWNAATASTGGTTISNNASGSICPKNWKLPADRGDGSYQNLFSATAENIDRNNYKERVRQYPVFFLASGYVFNSGIGGVGSYGRWWSSSPSTGDLNNARYFYFFNSAFDPFAVDGRPHGNSVRCVARDDIPDGQIQDTLIPNPNVSVTVDKILTMKLDSNEVNIEPKNGETMTGDFSATVSSNSEYTLSITAAEGASTSLVNQNDNIVIAEIPTITSDTSTLTPNVNNWAIRLCNDESKTNCNNYKPITPYGTTNIFLNNGTPTASTTSLFEVGIGISPDLPSGTYSTNILVTASQK